MSVETPCSKNFSEFTPTSNGGFCNSCSKNVVDFTKMSDAEILDYFAQKQDSTCGKFNPNQLGIEYSKKNVSTTYRRPKWIQTSILSLLLLLLGVESSAQIIDKKTPTEITQLETEHHKKIVLEKESQIVQGIVVDEEKSPLPGVNIYLKDSDKGAVSDIDGKFKFPSELEEGDILMFSAIGFETKEYIVPKEASGPIEIELIFYNLILGEVIVGEVYSEEPSGLSRWWHKLKSKF